MEVSNNQTFEYFPEKKAFSKLLTVAFVIVIAIMNQWMKKRNGTGKPENRRNEMKQAGKPENRWNEE